MKLIIKFGGTSIGDAKKIRNMVGIINDLNKENKIIIVISAFNGVTDTLTRISIDASKGHNDKLLTEIDELRKRHIEVTENTINNVEIRNENIEKVETSISELKNVIEGIAILREITPRSRDRVLSFGEKLSSNIICGAINDFGLKAKCFNGGEAGIITDKEFGEANPLMSVSKMKIVKNIEPLLLKDTIPIVTGFIASTQTGEITTLGRGGSDFTATILGATLSADEVWIFTDVNGMMTADPKIVNDSKTISNLSYSEALEMTVFGAKALHPRALEPARKYKIPVRVKNTYEPTFPGTLITDNQNVSSSEVAKSVATIRSVAMVNIGGAGMVGKPGIASRVFDILAKKGINILMISQSVSESNISIIIRRDHLEKAANSLEISLLGKGIANTISTEEDVAAIAVVGAGMKGHPGVAGRIFQAVATKDINIRMIAQGSSELNISFVVKERDCENAIRAIHEEFKMQ
jgi:aspartate kinase